MVPLDHLLAFAATSTVIIAIPGPGVLFVITRALSHGRSTAMFSAVGQEAGGFVLVLAVALGVGSVMEQSVFLFTLVKLAGAVYLVVLGVQAIVRRHADTRGQTGEVHSGGVQALRDGLVVGVTNPKGAVFFAAVLPQFTDRPSGHIPLQIVFLGIVFVSIALVCDASWSLLAAGARNWLARSPGRIRRLTAVGGAAMIGLGVSVALTGTKD